MCNQCMSVTVFRSNMYSMPYCSAFLCSLCVVCLIITAAFRLIKVQAIGALCITNEAAFITYSNHYILNITTCRYRLMW